MLHTYLMNEKDPPDLRIFRARLLRLAKRAVKRDAASGGVAVMCSWNLSALALEFFDEVTSLSVGLEGFFTYASEQIAAHLTADPSDAITDPIRLPQGITQKRASARLAEMAAAVTRANQAYSPQAARNELEAIFGQEIMKINERAASQMKRALGREDATGVAAGIGSAYPQTGSSWCDGNVH